MASKVGLGDANPERDGVRSGTLEENGRVAEGRTDSNSGKEAQTKSIMNASGTSGHVVNNTPEPGLKRVPTVTFSDIKPVTSKSSDVADVDRIAESIERTDFIRGNKIFSVGSGTTINNIVPNRSRTPDAIDPIAFAVHDTAENDHLHFVVGDTLHTPGKTSTLTSPRSSVGSNKSPDLSLPIKEEFGQQIKAVSIPKALEAVMEEGTFNSLPSKILKRENSKNIDPRLPQDDGKLHVLLGATGAVSVFKIKVIIKKLEEIYGRDKIAVQVILTQAATEFFNKKNGKKNKTDKVANDTQNGEGKSAVLEKFSENSAVSLEEDINCTNTNAHNCIELNHIHVWTDQDEWDAWSQRTDPVLHIELRRWADILVIAPLTANTLTKIALGLCDNLLTSVVRAWNPAFPIFLAPSMVSSTFNSLMTKKHLQVIKDEMPWITVFKPSEKVMSINGEIGLGGMMDSNEIVDKIVMQLGGYPEDTEENDIEDGDDDDEDDEKASTTPKEVDDDDEDEDEDDEDDEDDDDDEDDEDDEEEDQISKSTTN